MPAPVATDKLGEFGRAVRKRREERGLTQDRFAEAIGVTQSHVSSIERGAADIRVSTVAKIADALDLDLGELLAKLAFDRNDPDLQPTESYADTPREVA